ncbi:MAG: hypothetical protein KKA60_07390 [Proteobacteria bacterium]|nr:hypothetical protein [Pseudomonadota bacterium]
MKKWKLFAGLGLIFLLGASAGALGAAVWMDWDHPRHRFEKKTPEERALYILEKLSKRLDLTGDQKQAIAPIVERKERETWELYRFHRRAVRGLLEQGFVAIQKELTPPQIEKLLELQRKMEKRDRSRGLLPPGEAREEADPE